MMTDLTIRIRDKIRSDWNRKYFYTDRCGCGGGGGGGGVQIVIFSCGAGWDASQDGRVNLDVSSRAPVEVHEHHGNNEGLGHDRS